MGKLKAIIVDDEESARNVLSSLLSTFCPTIEIIATCSNVIEAVETIKKHRPDVVFLDIEMPNYAGYELVSFFEKINFEIIFVTAYDQYAIKAFEVSAVDYLLKPVEIKRLKESVNRLKNKIDLADNHNYQTLSENLKNDTISKIIIRHNNCQKVISIKNIIAIEAKEAYSCIHTSNEKYLMSKNLKHYETVLDQNDSFFRTHKSWIINISHLITFSKSKLEIKLTSGIIAKLSKYRKSAFEDALVK